MWTSLTNIAKRNLPFAGTQRTSTRVAACHGRGGGFGVVPGHGKQQDIVAAISPCLTTTHSVTLSVAQRSLTTNINIEFVLECSCAVSPTVLPSLCSLLIMPYSHRLL